MVGAGRRALDRTSRGLEDARNYDARRSVFDVRVELEALEEWAMNGARHGRIHQPMRRTRARFFAVHDGGKSVALLVVRSLIDDGLTLAVPFIDRPRPPIEESRAEAVERDISEVPRLDAHRSKAATVTVRGSRGLELARAGVVAVTIADFDPFDVPVDLRHRVLRQESTPSCYSREQPPEPIGYDRRSAKLLADDELEP